MKLLDWQSLPYFRDSKYLGRTSVEKLSQVDLLGYRLVHSDDGNMEKTSTINKSKLGGASGIINVDVFGAQLEVRRLLVTAVLNVDLDF